MSSYGTELIIDMCNCDTSLFTKAGLIEFFEELATLTDMELQARHWWTMDDCPDEWRDLPHLNGISCVQFISTSNFTVHALFDGRLYVNIFTCKPFDEELAKEFTREFFNGWVTKSSVITRQ